MPAMRLLASAVFFAAAPGLAAPRVAVDIAPVHSIAAAVMAGIGTPELIVPPGVSEHEYALRPSEASALEAADLAIWIGPSLTPWLAGPLDALAPDAARLTLQEHDGVRLLGVRDGGPFESHGHAHEDEADVDAHEHEDEAEHGHAEEAHADEHGGDHDEEAAGIDPHVWLDPQNASAIAEAMAGALAQVDPANATTYAQNAAMFAVEMEALGLEIEARLAPLRDRRYFVFHDAYRYFEDRFEMPASGSIALGDAEAPRAPRVAAIRDRFESEAIDCAFAEPQHDPKLIATVIEGTPTRTGTLDPLGNDLEPGPDLYPALLRGLAEDLAACLDPEP